MLVSPQAASAFRFQFFSSQAGNEVIVKEDLIENESLDFVLKRLRSIVWPEVAKKCRVLDADGTELTTVWRQSSKV